MSLVRNERLKLLANALDRASTACVTVGIVTPWRGWFMVAFALFGVPLMLLALGWGAVLLDERADRRNGR